MRTVFHIVACLAALLGAATVTGQGSGSNVGRSLAATCANCHGTNGVSVGEVASLTSRPKDEIVRKMQDFKAGRVPGTIMPQLAKGYTDEQIDLVAAWFSAQRAN